MLHRFEVPGIGVPGISAGQLRRTLDRLHKAGVEFVDVVEAFSRLMDDRVGPRPVVSFTVDDGYFDFDAVAADVFVEFDCPATQFLTTAFVDGAVWQWWDQIEYVFLSTTVTQLDLRSEQACWNLKLGGTADRMSAASQVSRACTRIPDQQRVDLIAHLAASADVSLPSSPPEAYRPISWDRARALERRGLRFGPHTVSHPILPFASEEAAEREIRTSWKRLTEELASPVPIFAYPNGDHGDREIALVKGVGLSGAVSTQPTYASGACVRGTDHGRFAIPRVPLPCRTDQAVLQATGFSRIPEVVRKTRVRDGR
jgi:peptidoglycan/xylan/chitin deacetylase (PgdA/CDA1 family)